MPPSEPRSSKNAFDALDAHIDRPARLQMIVALVLGLVLVAIPLYLWRRPRAEAIGATTLAGDAGALPAVVGSAAAAPDEALVVGEPKLLSCHDPGPKKTPTEQCDHVVELEKGLAQAVEENAGCVPREAGGGTLVYVADVAFAGRKKTVALTMPRESRTLKNAKTASVCERAIRTKLNALPLESMKHEHARYRLSITATYPGAARP